MTQFQQLSQMLLQDGLLPSAGTLTVAFSGGADSTALLCLLHSLQDSCGYTLHAVHVHHGIRGEEADRDAVFCQQLCGKRGIPYQQIAVDAPKFAKEAHLSLETAARQLRYEALEQAAPTGLIATAHHADDQAETMLFHLVRGSGLRGLCGIPARRGRIIRPLLQIPKADLLAYLEEIGQDFVTDSTNLLCDGSRNLLRHEVLPLLYGYNPQSIAHMSRTAALLSEDEALLSETAADAMKKCTVDFDGLAGLSAYPKPIRMRVYMQILRDKLQIDPAYEKLCEIDALLAIDGKISVTGDVYAQSCKGILYLYRKYLPLTDAPLPMQIGENRLFPHKICVAELLDTDAISRKIHKFFTKSTLDYDKIKGSSRFCIMRGSDRIQLPARNFSSSLKDCIQAVVPPPARRSLYVLYDDLGCIYCEGVGIAARVKPDADTKNYLRLTIRPAAEQKKE